MADTNHNDNDNDNDNNNKNKNNNDNNNDNNDTNVVVLIIGASGFIGSKLADRILLDGGSIPVMNGGGGGSGSRQSSARSVVQELVLADLMEPQIPKVHHVYRNTIMQVRTMAVDITDPSAVQSMISSLMMARMRPNVIVFHLAAIVSGQAEANFDLGYRVNVEGTRNVLNAIKTQQQQQQQQQELVDTKCQSSVPLPSPPRFVFSSSLAIYGPPFPDKNHDAAIPDWYPTIPHNSYGTQKAMAELLVADYTRKGYVDGICLRFPTIAIRPGKPNAAASSFFSSIVREPLSGVNAILPVDWNLEHTIASPRAAVRYLLRAATITTTSSLSDRTLMMPGICLSVREMVQALERVVVATSNDSRAAAVIRDRIQYQPDPFIQGIVGLWPVRFECKRALQLGFQPDESYDEIIRIFIEDEGMDDIVSSFVSL